MFTFIIATNRVTSELSKIIDTLLKTKRDADVVMIINYNNYSIDYRATEGIVYKHIRRSKKISINISLPKDGDTVILDSDVTIPDNFVEMLYKHYDPHSLCSLRVDKSTGNGRFIESDYRVGSMITPKSFFCFAMAFNTSIVSEIGETPEETANIASSKGVPLTLLPNVRVIMSSTKNKTPDSVGITVLIPSLKYKLSDDLKRDLRDNDRLYEFDSDPRGVTRFINQAISESSNNCILIVNPLSKMRPESMLNKIRGLFDNDKCLLFDTENNNITDDTWIVIPKTKYVFMHRVFDTITQLQNYIISYNNRNAISYPKIDNKKLSPNNSKHGDMISIIIPYMHNGDRWQLFEACIERLYNCTKSHNNIEIIIHECAPKRFIKPDFVNMYEIEYIFSEYHELFHRAWCLNMPARFIARGNTFVFFDGDLLIDETWVEELLSCDKSKSYVGWGVMKNISKGYTEQYIKTKVISGKPEKIREPDSYGAAGGINIIPRDVFFDMGGWPESYKDKGYGGEDNSLAFKMDVLGMYGEKMGKCVFKSTVWHLFHGHETPKDVVRHEIFNKHFGYKKEDWLEHIRKNYKWGYPVDGAVDLSKFKTYINESLLYVYRTSEKTRLTICMVNFLRYDKLINTLTILLSFNIPINIILWVNQSDSMPDAVKETVIGLLNRFRGNEIIYCKKNMGVGYPRHMMFNKAKFEFDSDYIVTMDDDTPHSCVDSLILASTVLDQDEYKDYGAIGVWCHPQFVVVKVVDNTLKITPSVEGFHTVDCLGSGTMTIRKEVLDKCNYDPQYIMGLEDWDFSLSMRKEGWKLGMVCDPRYKPINDAKDNSKEYTASRWNQTVIENSKSIFRKKWGYTGV